MEAISLPLEKALALNWVEKVPVPRSESFGIWISAEAISGLPPDCWCLISGTFEPPVER
jgi:hypothetical protein